MGALSDERRVVLELESSWWRYAGAKEAAIRERLGWSSTRYYQVLNALLDDPAALEHSPMVVNRLRRVREQRRRLRQTRPRAS
ncbi:DUF3263 domain-containing protein [Nocardioides pakistanensis]